MPQLTFRRPSTLLAVLVAAVLVAGLRGQQVEPSSTATFGPSESFCRLLPLRAKSFVKASSDPEDLPTAPRKGNDDGFSGANGVEAFRRNSALGEVAVLADIQGRGGYMGCFFRNFWSDWYNTPLLPEEYNRTQILLDGRVAHDLPLPDYFRNEWETPGQIAPFTGPFTGRRSGGHLTHTPLVWEDSFRLQVFENHASNAARFFKVSGVLAPPDEPLVVPDLAAWNEIANRRGAWPHAMRPPAVRQVVTIPAGGQRVVSWTGPGTVLGLSCEVGAHRHWADLDARFSFDNGAVPSEKFPLRLLGGLMRPPHRYPLQGLLFHNDADRQIHSYFPMPFRERGELIIENTGTAPRTLTVTSHMAPGTPPEPWGYFAPFYKREATETGYVFRGPDVRGYRGVYRHILLESSMDTTGRMSNVTAQHLEGDLCVRINGNRGDEHNYAASETGIGKFGWYSGPRDVPFNQDESFNTQIWFAWIGQHLFSDRVMGSTLVFDPIHFVDGINIVLEHGPQNEFNADYALFHIMYLAPGAGRERVHVIDVGNAAAEQPYSVAFTQNRAYTLTASFFRDDFYGTPPVTDEVREIRDFYRFRVPLRLDQGNGGYGLGFCLDRDRLPGGGVCQADVFVDGQHAGLLHVWNSNEFFRWKEGGETEVEIPRALTDGKGSIEIELRHRPGTDPLRLARVDVYRYAPQ